MRPSPIPPGTLSAGVTAATLYEVLMRLDGWQVVAALAIAAAVAISRAAIESRKVAP